MKVSGFTILRHAGQLGYPFIASITSLLPLVDELIAVVAEDDDTSVAALMALADERIRVARTTWHDTGIGGVELSRQTNIALHQCSGDWAIYLQADELLHEDDYDRLRQSMQRHLSGPTEGLLFSYRHFFRSYRWIADDWRGFYPSAIRVVRTGIGVESAGDAAGFVRRIDGATRGLIKAHSGARIFHYGWAGSADARLARAHRMRPLYSGQPSTLTMEEVFPPASRPPIRRFEGTHPTPIRPHVEAHPETFAPPTIARTPAWLRAWRDALTEPDSFRGWARHLLPVALTNLGWGLVDARRGYRRARARARLARFYRAFLSPHDLVFDVGANLGAHSHAFRAVGARVVAFEPHAATSQTLADSFSGDRDRDCILQYAAVSDTDGVAELHVHRTSPLSSLRRAWIERTHRSGRFPDAWTGTERVACTTLDTAIARIGEPAFIRIDVQGRELPVIRGLSRPIAALSLRFAAESIDDIRQCLDHLNTLARYEFRLAWADTLTPAGERWATAAETHAQLERARDADARTWGDVYARRSR